MGAHAVSVQPRARPAGVSQLGEFVRLCEGRTGHSFPDHTAFHDFSVAELGRFWRLLLDWSGLAFEGQPDPVCTDHSCEHATFFPRVRLSYVENLLAGDDEWPALSAIHADRPPDRLGRGELRDRVRAAAAHLRAIGVGPGDRVAALAGNNAEAVIAALATAAVGASFSSAAPEMGAPSVLSRFEQLAPKVLFASLSPDANGAPVTERVATVARGLPSLTELIALDGGPVPRGLDMTVTPLRDVLANPAGGSFERFGFNHPLFVLFTSGTTGRPKCIVHGAGGTLLEHVKEHRLHVDLGPGERLFFHTSTAWMMWNWQLSALATGAEIVLYDGPLAGPSTLWRLVAEERPTVFGTSPPYLQLCEDSGYSPRAELDLSGLRAILSTGSILHDWQYDWVAEHVGPMPLQSISGGTDIIGCFVLGNPDLPVERGWIQSRSLGMDVQALDGELVCRNPFPSRPLHLLDDPDGSRFHAAYFAQNPGVWTHGDLIELDDRGQARMHGRSDGVLNVHGVRIGPAEIYRALRGVEEVEEAMAVEHEERLVLLVVLRPGVALNGRLVVRIRREIARSTSALHVPELVVAVDGLPTTHSGKRSERAARDALSGAPSVNAEALANPDSLDAIRRAVAAAGERGAPPASSAGASTEARLRALWEAVLGVAPLQRDDNFFDIGGTSLAAVRLLQAIHERMGLDLPLSILLDAPTIAEMCAAIEAPERGTSRALVRLRPGSDERPLFLVHSLFGDVLSMRPLALALDTERAVYGLQARGLDPGEEPHTRVEEMADSYLASIRSVQPAGPYVVGGHSLGGLVAFEMARRLAARGDAVQWLGLIDSDLHHTVLTAPERLRWLARKAWALARAALADPRTRLPRYARKLVLRVAPRAPVEMPARESSLPPLLRRLENAGWLAFDAYRPSPCPVAATFFRVHERREDMGDPVPVWRRVARGGLTVETVPGSHADVVAEPNVRYLAERVSAHLATPASGHRSRHS